MAIHDNSYEVVSRISLMNRSNHPVKEKVPYCSTIVQATFYVNHAGLGPCHSDAAFTISVALQKEKLINVILLR